MANAKKLDFQPNAYTKYCSTYDDYYDRDDEEEFTPASGWHSTGNGDMVYAMAGEGPDYTACDKECGNCGRCTY